MAVAVSNIDAISQTVSLHILCETVRGKEKDASGCLSGKIACLGHVGERESVTTDSSSAWVREGQPVSMIFVDAKSMSMFVCV